MRDDEREEQFARFLACYPKEKRKGGNNARYWFQRALINIDFIHILNALTQQKRSIQWQNPRFIPTMTTWLEEERWVQVLPEPEIPLSRLTPFERARRYGLK